ncbi:MAG: transporter substrate-binding domain-containing protein [Rhizobacter sp.]|nr:transporter substrate-binding domain-containing protein [Chlorobiales bacterium]
MTFLVALWIAATWLTGSGGAFAQTAKPAASDSVLRAQLLKRKLIIGTIHAPPFVIRSADSTSWSGLSIDLWREIASDLGIAYEFRGATLTGLSDGLAEGELDAVVAAMTINPEREKRFDFTHPFFRSGIGITVSSKPRTDVWKLMSGIFSWQLALILLGVFAALFIIGVALYFLERSRSPERFAGGTGKGLLEGVWLSAIMFIGSSDGYPQSPVGRVIAILWTTSSTVLISALTATIAATLTSAQLTSQIQDLNDLRRVRVGTVAGSSSEAFLKSQQIAYTAFPKTILALQQIADEKLDAVVADAPIMRYLVLNDLPNGNLMVLPKILKYESYGFGLRAGSPLREELNRVLLEKLREPRWEEQFSFYSGGN